MYRQSLSDFKYKKKVICLSSKGDILTVASRYRKQIIGYGLQLNLKAIVKQINYLQTRSHIIYKRTRTDNHTSNIRLYTENNFCS